MSSSKPNSLPPQPLLVTRKQAAELLGNVSIATIRRLERSGVLHGKRLSRKATAQIFFHYEDVVRAAKEAIDAA